MYAKDWRKVVELLKKANKVDYLEDYKYYE